jgi:hypothetical protein
VSNRGRFLRRLAEAIMLADRLAVEILEELVRDAPC